MHTKKPHYLLSLDFDGTAFETIIQSSAVFSVNDAYGHAIIDIFGMGAYERFTALGGLKNRAPSEVIRELYQFGDRAILDANMQLYYQERGVFLTDLVPEGKGITLDNANISGEKSATELLVRGKLSYLLKNIGKQYGSEGLKWPWPTNGFIDFWNTVGLLKQEGGFHLETAIISSGHDIFIKNTFDEYGLRAPDITVTDDDLRGYTHPSDSRLLVKPHPLPLTVAYKEWIQRTGQDFVPQHADGMISHRLYAPFEARDRIMYFGDDPQKDGGLAASGGVAFGLYNSHRRKSMKDETSTFSNWAIVEDILLRNVNTMSRGESLKQIFSDTPALEVMRAENISLRRGVEW